MPFLSQRVHFWSEDKKTMPPKISGGGRSGYPTTLLGGILRCGRCGGAVVGVNAYRYGCAAREDIVGLLRKGEN